MAENEKITTSLEIDVTNFKKGLQDANRYVRMANSEFENATASMGKWSDNADGLRAKITQLNKTLEGQEAALSVLRAEYDRVVAEQGESSKGAQELAIRLNKQEAACKKTAAQVSHYSDALDEVEGAASEAGKATGDMAGSMSKAATAAGNLATNLAKIAGKTIANGIKTVAAASGALLTAFLASGETSKEYITEMGKLEAAYSASGHSAEAATKAYQKLQGVIGETDQSVEAAQQIALLANSEEDAARWAEQAAGVVGRFGDALQPEMFYESANETLKLNEATGAYVQMLEGVGMSVDKFNEGLQKCRTEEEKQAYMLSITEQALGSAGAAYRENNAAIIQANEANEKLAASMAGVGEAAMPVMSTLKIMGASLLSDMLPGIQQLGTAFTGLLNGSKTAAADMGAAIGGLLQQITQKIVTALPGLLTMGGSIVKSLIEGLVAAAPQLAASAGQMVQYFRDAAPQLLAAGGQMLEQLLAGINPAGLAQGAMDAVSGFVSGIQKYLPIVLEKGSELLGKLGDGIRTALPDLVSQALDIGLNLAQSLYDAAPVLIDTGFDLLSDLVSGILSALPVLLSKGPILISKFANIINDNFPRILKKGAELIFQIVKGLLSAIPELIKNIPKIITAIVDVWEAFNWLSLGKKAITWLKDGVLKMVGAVKTAGKTVLSSITNVIKDLPGKLLQFGKDAVSDLGGALRNGWSTVKSGAAAIFDGIVGYFKDLPGKMLGIGTDMIKGMWDGISDMTGWIIGKLEEFGDSVLGGIKKFFGISSPSKLLAKEVGRWLPAGVAEGVLGNTKAATKAMTSMARSAVGAANAELSSSNLNMPAGNSSGTAAAGGPAGARSVVFNQYNYSPKALNRFDVYRQTKAQLKFATQ